MAGAAGMDSSKILHVRVPNTVAVFYPENFAFQVNPAVQLGLV